MCIYTYPPNIGHDITQFSTFKFFIFFLQLIMGLTNINENDHDYYIFAILLVEYLACIKPLILHKLKEFDSLKSLKIHLAQTFDKVIVHSYIYKH
jgi:hypothetical protein